MDKLSAYIAGALTTELPPEVIEKAKLHILDTIAAIISGSRLLPGIKAVEYARTQGGAPEALVLGSDLLTNVVTAALANGMAAHADETDNSHKASRSHPGCGVLPAALALARTEQYRWHSPDQGGRARLRHRLPLNPRPRDHGAL